ncbi:MAG: CoB--CoM heterodisulfide reductase iron-sulfur subunit A family protein, partial [Bacteroidales bacterium]|nr:CoB--CoM heterodisulfide reductase iron-sulfur subunit A family protein [Bacteroidales bacterium]
MDKQKVLIVGAGIAGLEAASLLSSAGYEVTLVEKKNKTGGNVAGWDRLFPNRRPANEIFKYLKENYKGGVNVKTETTVTSIKRVNKNFIIRLSDGEYLEPDAMLLTTGFQLFDATRKEEYGYGIYDNVITSADLEGIFKTGRTIQTSAGKIPGRIGFVHCVGSRDEKTGNNYCSALCCVTGVKQAIEVKEMIPGCEVYNFYMDLRMYGRYYEELYREAQEKWGIQFIRGRLSEAAENASGGLKLKVEDTLAGRPLGITVDLLVLLVGMEPAVDTKILAEMLDINSGDDGFLIPADSHTRGNKTATPGIFLAGTCTGPKCINSTMADSRAAVFEIIKY